MNFLGVSEWLFGALLLAGFWNKKLGLLGALGSVATFIATVSIISFMPDGWAPSAGGFPAMVGNVSFLMKDVVLLAVSCYLVNGAVAALTRAVAATSALQWVQVPPGASFTGPYRSGHFLRMRKNADVNPVGGADEAVQIAAEAAFQPTVAALMADVNLRNAALLGKAQ
jgi:hypothetical protein